MSSGSGSFGMATSLMKGAGQDPLDAVNLGGDVARRQAGNLADSRRVHALQIREDHLAIQRLQLLHEGQKAAQRLLLAGVRRRRVRHLLQLFQADQGVGVDAALPYDMGYGGVVRHAINPGAQPAPRVPAREAAPEREVDLLQQVAAIVGVGLVRACQAFEGRAVCGGGFAVSVVLQSFHNQVVTCAAIILQTISRAGTLCGQREVSFGSGPGKSSAQSGAGYVSRLRHAAHDGRSCATLTGGPGAAGEWILEFPGLPSDARRVGGVFTARHHPAGVLVSGRGGYALLHRGAHRQGREVSRDVPARAVALAAAGRARRLSALHPRPANLLHVRRYAFADRPRLPPPLPAGMASAPLAVGRAGGAALRLLAGVGAVPGAGARLLLVCLAPLNLAEE